MVKTAVLVSGGGTNLQAILDANLFGELGNCELTAVISSSPDAYAVTRAKSANIPVYIIERDIFPNRESFCEAIIKKLHDLDIELVVMAGFAYTPTIALIREYENRIINIHSSLMPAFCGSEYPESGIQAAVLERGVKVTGATAYFVAPTIEESCIIMQQAVPVMEDDTPATLQQRVLEEAEWPLLPKVIALFCDGKLELDGIRVRVKADAQAANEAKEAE